MNLYTEIEKTFPIIEQQLSPKTRKQFMKWPAGKLYSYHFGLEMWIRNHFFFDHTKVPELHNLFVLNGFTHEDDMSHLILQLFHYHLVKREESRTPS